MGQGLEAPVLFLIRCAIGGMFSLRGAWSQTFPFRGQPPPPGTAPWFLGMSVLPAHSMVLGTDELMSFWPKAAVQLINQKALAEKEGLRRALG